MFPWLGCFASVCWRATLHQLTDLDRWVDLSVNTPVLEGDKIGLAGWQSEVEFENGSLHAFQRTRS
jgi:hypothetical protein